MNVIRQFFAHVFEKPEGSLVPVHLLRLAALVCMGLAVVELFIGLPGDAAKKRTFAVVLMDGLMENSRTRIAEAILMTVSTFLRRAHR